MDLASTPEPPYVMVVFTSLLGPDHEGYREAAARMDALVRATPGFLGTDSAHVPGGVGITVSYFRDEEAVRAWREQPEHAANRATGRTRWYDAFEVRVATVDRAYSFRRDESTG